MAESNQDTLPAPSLYFCHKCAVEVTPQLPDHVCPRCQDGFIEPVNSASSSSSSSDSTGSPNSLVFDMDNDDHSNNSSLDDLDPPITSINPIRDMLYNPSPFSLFHSSGNNSGGAGSSGSDAASSARRNRNARTLLINGPFRRNRMRGPDRNQTLAPMLQNLIVHISHGVAGGGDPLNMLGEELASNPGDYAWGRGGLDAVITHLLNQMEGNGAPPLNQTQIESIPVVKINQEQIDGKVSCSVCMEDFNLSEDARKLKCEHCFHESCITPWLKMHATCPVCRTTLNEENGPNVSAASSAATGTTASNSRPTGLHTPLLRTTTNGSGTTTIIMSTSRGGGDTSESTATNPSGPLVEDPVE